MISHNVWTQCFTSQVVWTWHNSKLPLKVKSFATAIKTAQSVRTSILYVVSTLLHKWPRISVTMQPNTHSQQSGFSMPLLLSTECPCATMVNSFTLCGSRCVEELTTQHQKQNECHRITFDSLQRPHGVPICILYIYIYLFIERERERRIQS